MTWIAYSTVLFVGSVTYYLLVKKIQKLGVNRTLYMAINYLMPLVLYFALILISGKSFVMSPLGFLVTLLSAILFNYIGTIIAFKAVESAPNIGYSVIIQKSYAIYTSIASVFLFGSELPIYKFFAILLILFFTGLIAIDVNVKKKASIGKWAWLSFIVFFLFGGITLSSRYAVILGEDPLVFLFWVILTSAVISVFQYLKENKGKWPKVDEKTLLWLFAMSLAVSVFYWGLNMSAATSPNVGYTGAINASSNAALTVASAIIYKEELKLRKLIGVVGVVIGLIILIW